MTLAAGSRLLTQQVDRTLRVAPIKVTFESPKLSKTLCDQIWRNFNSLWDILAIVLVLYLQTFVSTLVIFMPLGKFSFM